MVVDVLDAASARVSGLAPETLNTITKISGALDNDPLIFQKIQAKQQKITYGTTITGSQSLLSSTTPSRGAITSVPDGEPISIPLCVLPY